MYGDRGGGSSSRDKYELSLGHVKIKVLKTLWLPHVLATSFHLALSTTIPHQPIVYSHGLQIMYLLFKLDSYSQVLPSEKQVWEEGLCH